MLCLVIIFMSNSVSQSQSDLLFKQLEEISQKMAKQLDGLSDSESTHVLKRVKQITSSKLIVKFN